MTAEMLSGRYRLEGLLGRGGMGEVYRAFDVVAGRRVAVKLLSGSADARSAQRLRREADLVMRLSDPHIVEVLDSGEVDGRLHVVMRLVEGADLRRVLAGGSLDDPGRAVCLLTQVARALDAAHAGGVVHRDVKPSNILVGPQDDAHLTDFGIARPLDPEATRMTRTGAFIGSLNYIAPEQLCGRQVTGTADVYALACVFYECLTGKVPFPADDPASKLAAQLNDPPAAPSVFDPRIPPALDLVLATGMDKDPDRRFTTAGELMTAAAATLEEAPVVESAAPTAEREPPEPGRDAIARAIVRVAARRQEREMRPSGGARREAGHASGSPPEEPCPFPGLRTFGPDESAWFYGRDSEVTDLLVRLSQQSPAAGPLVVVGASGAGKSSLLRAGLLPELEEAGYRWPRVLLTPGERPVETLAARLSAITGADPAQLTIRIRHRPQTALGDLLRPAGHTVSEPGSVPGEPGTPRLLLVVDQFEQLFTDGTTAAEREAYVRALAHAWPVTVVLAVRADYIPDCIGLEPLKRALDAPFVVSPLRGEKLREVITEPARHAGLEVEDGLADRLTADVGARPGAYSAPGALPRLAHALRETWANRSPGRLTLRGYQATGGVDRAVAVSADQLHARLGPAEQVELRTALLRLVKVLPDGGLARRRADRGELPERTLSRLVEARLVSTDDEGVRLAHDALLTAWPRLRGWVEADRRLLLLRQRLEEAAAGWRDGGRDRGDLYRGARLGAALEWAEEDGRELGRHEREFLLASRREQQRSTRRLRTVASGLAVLLISALVAGGLALDARGDAQRQARVATSRELAATSRTLAESDPMGARRTALKAWRTGHTAEARGALISADGLNAPLTFDSGLASPSAVDVSSDGTLVAVGGKSADGDGGSRVVVRRARSGGDPVVLDTPVGKEAVLGVRFSPDGTLLAVATAGLPAIRIWDVDSGEQLTVIGGAEGDDGPVVVAPFTWHPDGTTLAAQAFTGGETRFAAWNPRTGERKRWLTQPVPPSRGGFSAAYSPDGSRLAVGRVDGSFELWDPRDGTLLHHDTAHRDAGDANAVAAGVPGAPVQVAFSGQLLATASVYDPTVRLRDADTGELGDSLKFPQPILREIAGGPVDLTFSSDGARLLMAAGAHVYAWDTVTREWIGPYPMGTGQGRKQDETVFALAAADDGNDVVFATAGGRVVHWRGKTPWYAAPDSSVAAVAFAPEGGRMAAVDTSGKIHTWDWSTGRTTTGPRQLTSAGTAVAYGPDGTLVTGAWDGTLSVDPPHGRATTLDMDGGRLDGVLALSRDGTWLAAASDPSLMTESTVIHVWNLADGYTHTTLELPTRTAVSTLVFSPQGDRLLAVSSSFAPDGGGTAADGPVRLSTWRTGDLQRPPTTVRIADDIIDAAYTPDGTGIVAASVTGRIQIRDAAGGELRREFGRHPSAISELELSPDGSTLATATTDDAGVWLWDLSEGTLLARLTSGDGVAINDLAFSPDSQALARAGTDTDVAVWRLDTEDAVRRICRSLRRSTEKSTENPGCG